VRRIYLSLIGFMVLGSLWLSPVVGAQGIDGCSDNNNNTPCGVIDPACVGVSNSTLCGENTEQTLDDNALFGENGILTKAAQIITIMVGVASVIMIIIGGLQYIMASGDSTNITNAKNTILYAIIGLVVTLLAQTIISFVLLSL
jgi:hypothetical protein